MYIEKIWEKVRENKWDQAMSFVYSSQIRGCTEKEVAKLEDQIGLKLPKAYKEFMIWAGNGLGTFEIGSEFYYDQDLVDLQRMANDLLLENNFPQKLPKDSFVFWGHQGYMFCFFLTSEGDDPPVHYYRESFEKDFAWNYHRHFTDFLLVEMRDQAHHAQNAQEIEARLARDWQNA